MSDDDIDNPLSPDERQALRQMLRDPSAVKDMFNRTREIYSRGLERLKLLRNMSPDPSSLEKLVIETKTQLDLNDTIEAIALNEIQLREQIKQAIDATITNNFDKLKEIRQQIEK